MDNGLIFPYPRAAVQAGPPDAKRLNRGVLRDAAASVRSDGAVGEPEGDAGGQLYRAVVVPGYGCSAAHRQIRVPWA